MKILLYFEGQNVIGKSGIGRALSHQKRALSSMGIDYTLDPKATDYDILHINTYGPRSLQLVRKAKRLGKKLFFMRTQLKKIFVTHLSDQISWLLCLRNGWLLCINKQII